MKSGIIKLVDNVSEEVRQDFKYKDPKERKVIIEKWKNIYGENIRTCYISIIPNI